MNRRLLLIVCGLLLVIFGVSIGRYVETTSYEKFLEDFEKRYIATSSDISSIKTTLKCMDQDLFTLKFEQETILLAVKGYGDEDEDDDDIDISLCQPTPTPKSTKTNLTPTPTSKPTPTPNDYRQTVEVLIPEPTCNVTPIVSAVPLGQKEESPEPELSASDIQKLLRLLELLDM